jgi:hypothetical protein
VPRLRGPISDACVLVLDVSMCVCVCPTCRYVPDRVPGNVQPDTPLFKAPGDVKIRTKEINNGASGGLIGSPTIPHSSSTSDTRIAPHTAMPAASTPPPGTGFPRASLTSTPLYPSVYAARLAHQQAGSP